MFQIKTFYKVIEQSLLVLTLLLMGGWICPPYLFLKTKKKLLRICTVVILSSSYEDTGIFREFQLCSDGEGAVCANNR